MTNTTCECKRLIEQAQKIFAEGDKSIAENCQEIKWERPVHEIQILKMSYVIKLRRLFPKNTIDCDCQLAFRVNGINELLGCAALLFRRADVLERGVFDSMYAYLKAWAKYDEASFREALYYSVNLIRLEFTRVV